MEWRNGIAWTPPLTYVVDPWLLLAGDISVLARLTVLFYFILFYSTVAVTGRKYLRPRPVDCDILLSFDQPVAGILVARLSLFICAGLLCDYYCLLQPVN